MADQRATRAPDRAPDDTHMARRMADLALDLRSQPTSVLTLQHVVRATSELVPAADDVAVSVTTGPTVVETQASLHDLAVRADQLQRVHREGPCIPHDHEVRVVWALDLPHDGLWPSWSRAAVEELDIHSVLSVRLHTHEDQSLGALQLFAHRPGAFDAEAVDAVVAIAAHAAVALAVSSKIEAMQFGLVRRTLIGQATGMLMERHGLDQHLAFELLRRASQDSRRKLFDIASELVEGARPGGL